MTANEFRRMALRLPDAIEAAHMGHPVREALTMAWRNRAAQ